VVAIGQAAKMLAVRMDHEGVVRTLDGDEIAAGRLAHVYAVTVHRSQGSTVERAHSSKTAAAASPSQ
jgi:ATP-dependent exoDNAse (exonuclease V) alpha subunit